jgi:hypothetical protein
MTVIGSGGGAQLMMKAQASWGGTFMTTGQRSVPFKTAKLNYDPHYVQGGPYLSGGQLAPLGSARIQTWQDAKITLTVDILNTAMVPLLIATLGTGTLSQIGTTIAYGIGGAAGVSASAPDLNSTYLDIQLNVPDDAGALHAQNFHSCVVQKAEFMFDRAELVTGTFDLIAQQVETSSAALTYTANTSLVPFAMNNATATAGSSLPAHTSGLAFGTYNSEVSEPGIKKATITLDRKLAAEADRMYLGYQFQQNPVTNDYVDLGVSLDIDYTSATQANLWSYLLGGNLVSVLCQSVIGTAIVGTSYPTFMLQIPSFGVDSPDATPSPDGYKIVSTTMSGVGHIDPAGDPWLNCIYQTADTAP